MGDLIILWINSWMKKYNIKIRLTNCPNKTNLNLKIIVRVHLKKIRKLRLFVNLVVHRAKEGGKKIQIKLKTMRILMTNNLKGIKVR